MFIHLKNLKLPNFLSLFPAPFMQQTSFADKSIICYVTIKPIDRT